MPEEETAVVEETKETTTEATQVEGEPSFDWRNYLTDDIDRNDPSLQTIHGKTIEEVVRSFAKQHVHSQRAIGLDKIAIPSKDASDEEQRIYMTQLGCPETVDGYTVPTENLSEKFDADLFNSAREEAHRLGLTPSQLAGMSRFLDTRQTEAREAAATASATQIQEWETSIQKKHGDAFAQNTAMAKAIIHEYGGDEMETLLEERGLGSHPALFNMLTKVARALGEDEVVGQGGTHSFASTPDQAKAEWNALQLDEKFMGAYQSNEHPGHEGAVKRVRLLFEAMRPDDGKGDTIHE